MDLKGIQSKRSYLLTTPNKSPASPLACQHGTPAQRLTLRQLKSPEWQHYKHRLQDAVLGLFLLSLPSLVNSLLSLTENRFLSGRVVFGFSSRVCCCYGSRVTRTSGSPRAGDVIKGKKKKNLTEFDVQSLYDLMFCSRIYFFF